MKFQSKVICVDAVRFMGQIGDKDNRTTLWEDAAPWIIAAVKRSPYAIDSVNVVNSDTCYVRTAASGVEFANIGDYVVRDQQGNLRAVEKEVFESKFEPTNNPSNEA